MQPVSFELSHLTLAGVSYGDNEQPKVIALHGWLDNAASYQPLAQYVEGYHLIAIDWPGHGHSQHRPLGANYQLLDYVYDLHNVIISQGWCKVHIVAHSLGAIVASIFAATFPELVDKLVLIEGLGPLTAKPEQTTTNIRKSVISQLSLVNKSKPVHQTIDSAIQARTNASDFSYEIAELLVRRALVPTKGGYTWRSDIRLRGLSPWRMSEAQAQDIVSAIKSDTLLIIGSKGMKMIKEGVEQRQQLIEKLTLVELAGGHHVHMEQPILTWRAIAQHLQANDD